MPPSWDLRSWKNKQTYIKFFKLQPQSEDEKKKISKYNKIMDDKKYKTILISFIYNYNNIP